MTTVVNKRPPVPGGGLIASVLLLLLALHPVTAAQRKLADRPLDVPAAAAEAGCGMLARADLTTLQDAPAHVTAAKWVKSQGAAPPYCRVRGYVEPHVGFDPAARHRLEPEIPRDGLRRCLRRDR